MSLRTEALALSDRHRGCALTQNETLTGQCPNREPAHVIHQAALNGYDRWARSVYRPYQERMSAMRARDAKGLLHVV